MPFKQSFFANIGSLIIVLIDLAKETESPGEVSKASSSHMKLVIAGILVVTTGVPQAKASIIEIGAHDISSILTG